MRDMRCLKRTRVRKSWLPDFVIYLKGCYHVKKKMIFFHEINDGKGKIIHTAHLHERRSSYEEYCQKLKRKAELMKAELHQKRASINADIKINTEVMDVLQKKLIPVENPMFWNEYRLKKNLEKRIEELQQMLTESNARMAELDEKEKKINAEVGCLLVQHLDRERARAYVYLAGVNQCMKTGEYCIKNDDFKIGAFENLNPQTEE